MVLRLSAWGIFLLGAVGLLIHSTLLQTGHIRAGMFCFYTNLSNLLVLVYELALAIAAGLPHSAALRLLTDDTLSFSMALCTLVTHLVYQFILVPDAKRNGKRFADFGASFGNLCVHYLTPLLVVAQWLLLADKSSLGWRSALWWLTLPLAYFAFAMLRGRSGKPIGHTHLVYPYPFLDLPRPISSRIKRLREVAQRRISLTSVISTIKVDCPADRSSEAPMRVKMRSTMPMRAALAGTKEPIWAMSTIRATCRI